MSRYTHAEVMGEAYVIARERDARGLRPLPEGCAEAYAARRIAREYAGRAPNRRVDVPLEALAASPERSAKEFDADVVLAIRAVLGAELADCLSSGLTHAAAAARLNVGVRTVERRVSAARKSAERILAGCSNSPR